MNKDPAKSLSPFTIHSEKFYTLGLMTNRIAHELNNSMQGILLLVNFLEMDYPSNENITLLSQEIYKIKNLLQSLSNYVKADTIEFAPLDLRAVINKTLALLNNLTGYAVLTKIKTSSDGPFMVKGNFCYLQLALLNLFFHCCSQVSPHKKSSNIEIELGTEQQSHTVLIRHKADQNKKQGNEIKFEKLDVIQNIFHLHQAKFQAVDEPETGFIVTFPSS